MKCMKHETEAIAVCSNCGIGLCYECSEQSKSGKYCCSTACIDDVELGEEASRLTLERATKTSEASAYSGYFLGILFLGFSAYALTQGFWHVVTYMGLFGLGMLFMGYMFQRSASAKKSVNKKI